MCEWKQHKLNENRSHARQVKQWVDYCRLWLANSAGFISPLSSSIQLWTVSGGWVSLMCFKASSSSTSPVGASDLQITLANKSQHIWTRMTVNACPRLTSCVNRSHYTSSGTAGLFRWKFSKGVNFLARGQHPVYAEENASFCSQDQNHKVSSVLYCITTHWRE